MLRERKSIGETSCEIADALRTVNQKKLQPIVQISNRG